MDRWKNIYPENFFISKSTPALVGSQLTSTFARLPKQKLETHSHSTLLKNRKSFGFQFFPDHHMALSVILPLHLEAIDLFNGLRTALHKMESLRRKKETKREIMHKTDGRVMVDYPWMQSINDQSINQSAP